MSDQFVAEIRIFPFNFPPTGWAFCNGQLLPISQNTALFSLLGTTYGGDGKSTFALPDLQGAAAMQPGQGQGLSLRDLGEMSGVESVTLLTSEIPVHTHTLMGSTASANSSQPDVEPAGKAQLHDRPHERRGGGLQQQYAQRDDEPAGPRSRRRRSSAQQHAALSHGELLHRHAGHLSATTVNHASTPSNDGSAH